MSKITNLTELDMAILVRQLATRLANTYQSIFAIRALRIYPVPRGGVPVAYRLLSYDTQLVDTPEEADVIIDDLIDSGSTQNKFLSQYPDKGFHVLIDKQAGEYENSWVTFPWERGDNTDESLTDNIRRIIQYIGDDPDREGLLETPDRVSKSYKEIFAGYGMEAKDVLKVFTDGAGDYNEMVVVNDIPFYSACEHHMEAIFGVASIAYIPCGKIVGLSKLSRVLDVFARRLQVQERLTVQIADALQDTLKPLGVGVLIRARHLCMERRGVCKQGHHTVTCALRGVMRNDEGARAEFLKLTDTRPVL